MPDKIPWKILDKKKFKVELFSSNLNLPVNISFISKRGSKKNDPLLYVTELYSGIKVVKNDGSHETFAKDLLNYIAVALISLAHHLLIYRPSLLN
ncbi:unnamed protein product [marine sediment metagenome]|uniref:Uncharacterized protein n=1 Tax=marine sediment metagenome TaxID=412755 RepID=X1CGM2_9ZZZZ